MLTLELCKKTDTVRLDLSLAKLALLPELTTTRPELWAALLAVEVSDLIVNELDLKLEKIQFNTDSKVVLHNKT